MSAVIIPIRPGIAIPTSSLPANVKVMPHPLRRHLPGAHRPDITIADRQAVKRLRDAHPDLGPFGLWYSGALITREKFDAGRDAMTDGDHLAQFRRAMAFLLVCVERRQELNRRSTTYGLKHQVEGALRAIGEREVYVSNGMFLAAALSLGFQVEAIARTPNAFTNAFPRTGRWS